MLKELRLTNIVLIETAEIPFSRGFNVLSGESGSGKSAIMNALNLIAGSRCDPALVRSGREKGIIEAIFDIESLNSVSSLLELAGLDHEQGADLIIRREIFATGKSRAFVNNQAAQISILKQLSDHLFEIVGQHANQKLLSLEYHQQTLDLFGDLLEERSHFTNCWEEELSTRKKLETLISTEAERLRDAQTCLMEIEEIEDVNLKEDEEDLLFAEYAQLSNADLLIQQVGDINNALLSEKSGILPQLSKHRSTLEHVAGIDVSLKEIEESYRAALIELQEIARTLSNYQNRIESNPERLSNLNDRLAQINRLKRKYGSSVKEIQTYLKKAKERLHALESADSSIEALQEKLAQLEEKSTNLSSILTKKRQIAANELAVAVVHHLRALNMPKVEFIVELSRQKRGRLGDDKIEFFLVPNFGERRVSLRECASGGELSRIMLALQALLAGKELTPTLIFDEVDSNIGGETAVVVGQKLEEIGGKHQVVCITHFPQVAKLAKYHLHIYKEEIDGRTVTRVKSLDEKHRKKEFARMLGGVR